MALKHDKCYTTVVQYVLKVAKYKQKRYFDFHTKYLITVIIPHCQSVKEAKDSSSIWPMHNFCETITRHQKLQEVFE
jgi:hypothetical protein